MARRKPDRRRVTVAEKKRIVWELAVAGNRPAEIVRLLQARKPPISLTPQRVGQIVNEGLAEVTEETRRTADEYRQMQLAQLNEQRAAVWPHVKAGNVQAGHLAIAIQVREAELLGLDAPKKLDAKLGLLDIMREALEDEETNAGSDGRPAA